MTTQVSVLFRVNADAALGLGHVSRCRSLMLALSMLSTCRFAVMTDSRDVVQSILSGIDCELYEVGEATSGTRFDIAVVDVPDPESLKENFRDIADLLVCVDDSGPGLRDQDILIRPNLMDLPKPAGMPVERYWTGLVIMHPDFAMQGSLPVQKTPGISELFVCFGGSDPCGITLRAVNALKCLGADVLIRIVQGAAFQWGEELELLLDHDARFIVERNIPDMARALRNADVALISGGTLLYEACASGVPSVVICQNNEQQVEADVAHAAGAAISLGTNTNVLDEDILSTVERLLGDTALRQKMACQGISLVSPDGAARLATRLLSNLRMGSEA